MDKYIVITTTGRVGLASHLGISVYVVLAEDEKTAGQVAENDPEFIGGEKILSVYLMGNMTGLVAYGVL